MSISCLLLISLIIRPFGQDHPHLNLSPIKCSTQQAPATCTITEVGNAPGITVSFPTHVISQGVLMHTPFTPAPNIRQQEEPLLENLMFPNHPLPLHPPQESAMLPTPVNHRRLETLLDGYDDNLRSYLVSGFKFGFRLFNFTYYPQPPPSNLKSAYQLPEVVDLKLKKELDSHRIAGPFQEIPLPEMVFSPLGLQPKKVQGEFRVIHHLSYPAGKSVNDGIPQECASVHYTSVGQAIQSILRFGKGSYLAKTDIKSAFRIVPVHPRDYHLLGFYWRGGYYYDRCLPMGCSSSCAIFEAFSTSLEWIFKKFCPQVDILHVLDDFLIVGPSYQICNSALKILTDLCHYLGVPLAPDKTVGPVQALSFVGIFLDTVDMSASLPEDKIIKFQNTIQLLLSARSATLKQIQSLTGMLNFACGVIAPARAFSRRLYDLEVGLSKPHHHAKITKQVKQDLAIWQIFLQTYNRKSFFLDFRFLSQTVLRLFTDASTTIGYGGYFGSRWFSGVWSSQCSKLNIAVLEIYPILIALRLFSPSLRNKCIILMSDNMAVVHVLNSFSSKDPHIMAVLRQIVLLCMSSNILIRSQHCPGHINVLADLLSRSQEEKALRLYPHLERHPTPVPDSWTLDKLLKL